MSVSRAMASGSTVSGARLDLNADPPNAECLQPVANRPEAPQPPRPVRREEVVVVKVEDPHVAVVIQVGHLGGEVLDAALAEAHPADFPVPGVDRAES